MQQNVDTALNKLDPNPANIFYFLVQPNSGKDLPSLLFPSPPHPTEYSVDDFSLSSKPLQRFSLILFLRLGINSVNSDEAVSSAIRLKAFISKAFHGVSKSLKNTLIKVGEPIYKALDFLLNRRGGGGGGGEGGDGEEGDVQGGDGEEGHVQGGDGQEGDVEGRGGDKKKSRPTPEMLQLIATTTIANTAQIFGSAISLKVRGLALSSKVLLILVMATGLAGYLFSITAILQMHKRPGFSRVWVWTGCAATALGLLIVIVVFVLEL